MNHSPGIDNNTSYVFRTALANFHPTVGGYHADWLSSNSDEWSKRIAVVPALLVNGVLANVPLFPALAGFRSVFEVKGLFVSDAVDSDTVSLTFQDEDDTALNGTPAFTDVDADANKYNTELAGMTLWTASEKSQK